jgi:hypothetical protein
VICYAASLSLLAYTASHYHLSEVESVVKSKLDPLGRLPAGMRIRERPSSRVSPDTTAPGRIRFDDRGNAIYEWQQDKLAAEGEQADRLRQKALTHHGLAIVDDTPKDDQIAKPDPKGLRLGYNPYASGMHSKQQVNKKRDLRALSKWIEQKKTIKVKED